jgi:hypothetical protein
MQTKTFRWKARLGDQNHTSTLDDANLIILDILEATVHPEYIDKIAYFDIAILVTSHSVTFSRGILPVCLPR